MFFHTFISQNKNHILIQQIIPPLLKIQQSRRDFHAIWKFQSFFRNLIKLLNIPFLLNPLFILSNIFINCKSPRN